MVRPDLALFQVRQQPDFFNHQQHTVIEAPEDEVPVCSVPEAGKEPYYKNVEQLASQTLAVAAKGDIYIFLEPAGQCDVPAPPKFSDTARNVRQIEVVREIKAQHFAHADAHHRIAGKIEVDLQGIGNDAKPHQRCRRVGQSNTCFPYAVYIMADHVVPKRADTVGQQHFFGKPEDEQ